MKNIDWVAVRGGALLSIVICLPIALLSQAIVDQSDENQPGIVYVLYIGVLIGFVAGGWLAGRKAAGTPYTSGAIAALCGFVAIQAAGVIARLISGDDIRVVLIVTNGLLAYGAGLLGARLSLFRKRAVE